MFHQKAADSGIFSQAFYHRLHLKPGGFKLAVPGFRIISCHIVLGVISGYDHKGSQNHLGRIIFFYHPHQAFHGRISLYRAKENIFVAFVLKGVIQGSVNRVGIMGGTVAHKYQHLILGKVRKFIGNCLDHCKIVFCAGEERIPEGDGVKIITVSQGVFFHQIIFDAVDHMGRLYQNVGNPVFFHLFHSFHEYKYMLNLSQMYINYKFYQV